MIHTEIAKIAKQPTDKPIDGVIQSKSVFVTLAISVCKIPFRKDVPHRDRKDRKAMDRKRIDGVIQSKIGLCDLGDLCV
jgi:hypothetical protein